MLTSHIAACLWVAWPVLAGADTPQRQYAEPRLVALVYANVYAATPIWTCHGSVICAGSGRWVETINIPVLWSLASRLYWPYELLEASSRRCNGE